MPVNMENPTGNPKAKKPETEMENRNPESGIIPEPESLIWIPGCTNQRKQVLQICEIFLL